MDSRLKQARKDIRFYFKGLTKDASEFTDNQLGYYLDQYKHAQSIHLQYKGARYSEYELPKPFSIGSMTIV